VRLPTPLLCLLVSVSLLLCGCIGPVNYRETPQQTILELKKSDSLDQRVPAILAHVPATPVGSRIGDLYFTTLLDRIGRENHLIKLITVRDTGFPEFMQSFTNPTGPKDLYALAENARSLGFQGIISAAVLDIHPKAEENGVLWWRKKRFYVSVAVSFDMYDPCTGSKMISRVEDKTIKIDQMEYQQLEQGQADLIEDLDAAVTDLAETIGEHAAEVLSDEPWKTSVAKIEGEVIELAAGGLSGLSVGDRLVVFQGRRRMQGPQGEQFIVPGYKVGRITVTSVEGRSVTAIAEEPGADIAVGDIAVVSR
jgi:hypothetical protein